MGLLRARLFGNKKDRGDGNERAKKEARRGLFCFERGSIKLTIEVKEDTLEVGFVEDLLVFSGPEEESSPANIVNETRNALGVKMEVGHKRVCEKLVVVVGQAEMMFDISGRFLKVERGKGVANGDALVESLVGSKTKFSG